MIYENERYNIEDGDIVFVERPKHKFSFFANTISFFTNSPIYHCGFAVWLYGDEGEKRLFIVEADISNRRLIPLTVYRDRTIRVVKSPSFIKWNRVANEIIGPVGEAKYSIVKAIEAGLRKYFLLPRITNEGEICSEMCLRYLKMAGLIWTGTNVISPVSLYEGLLLRQFTLKCVIDGTE
jgi:hypothetical protein